MEEMIAKTKPERLRLGEILVQNGWISREQLEQALVTQKTAYKALLGEILIRDVAISSEFVYRAIAIQFNKKFMLSLENFTRTFDLNNHIPKAFLEEHTIIPLQMQCEILMVAVSDPLDIWPLSQLELLFQSKISEIILSTPDAIRHAIKAAYDTQHSFTPPSLDDIKGGRK